MHVRSDEGLLKVAAEEIDLKYIRGLKWTGLGGYWIWKESKVIPKFLSWPTGQMTALLTGLIIQELRSSHLSLFQELLTGNEDASNEE